ncbi:hypothetical protein WR164_08590 [Philodulcilactobacillus myokoensis]|uniref:DegV family protein n=1 Tax=Philodulcilactobacillus myokoensis TaxID=2929573 RepID=A0A9W6ESK6_9LACO|nr:DegV family protein [Philodulcilactobacillus myokoensis]GLB46880.1 hypothetical protein WR164_08590 [Philodulcilactobacillus myokoensis]
MSNKIRIATDSTAGLTDEEIKKYHIAIVPLSVVIDGTTYVERETISNDEFYQKMKNAKNLPKTSQPPLGKFLDTFNQLGKDGSSVISINIYSKLSGTYKTAQNAANLSSTDVTVVDSKTTDRALAFQVLEACHLASQGADVKTIVNHVKYVQDHTELFMGVLNLKNLVKGGRLNAVAGMITSLLNIKIVLSLKNGHFKILSKGRGEKSIRNFFNKKIFPKMKSTPHIQKIGISYVGETKLDDEVKNKIQEIIPNSHVLMRETVPIIATHAGIGAFALMYYNCPDK